MSSCHPLEIKASLLFVYYSLQSVYHTRAAITAAANCFFHSLFSFDLSIGYALRHTFAANCIRAGVDVRTLSEMIGHTRIAFTLQQYVDTNLTTMREAMGAVKGMRGL